jgi:sulfonate transport system substrate-binding protein
MIRVGGVPEHYNAPIHLALEIMRDLEFVSFPSGTGAMLESLDKGEIDLAILLTEGVCKHSLTTGRSKILGTFVDNPLPWGVHVKCDGPIGDMESLNNEIENLTFGISRLGSGSHLMAIVHASRLSGSKLPKFKIVDTMKGARDAMMNGEIDVFLWDITTADVYSRQGVWKVIGTVSGDWPAFVFAISSEISESSLSKINRFIEVLKTQTTGIKNEGPWSVEYLVWKFKISSKQATDFLENIRWTVKREISGRALTEVINTLKVAGIIENKEYELDSVLSSACSRV